MAVDALPPFVLSFHLLGGDPEAGQENVVHVSETTNFRIVVVVMRGKTSALSDGFAPVAFV